MDDEIKAFRIKFSDSDNGYIVVCRANGDLKRLIDHLKNCSGCALTEISRDKIGDDQAMGKIYLEHVKNDEG